MGVLQRHFSVLVALAIVRKGLMQAWNIPSSEVLQKTIEKGEYSIWVSEADTKEAEYLSLTLSLNNSMDTDHFHFSPGLGESSTRE